MTGKELVLRQTAAKIMARQKFLESVIAFVQFVVGKNGEVIERDVCRFHIRTKAVLQDFFGFSFSTDGVQTDFGGDTIEIWYKPFSEDGPVLWVSWHDIKNLQVMCFEESSAWQQAIRKLMRDKKKTDARFNQEKKRNKDRARRSAERIAKLQTIEKNLQEDSKRLGFG